MYIATFIHLTVVYYWYVTAAKALTIQSIILELVVKILTAKLYKYFDFCVIWFNSIFQRNRNTSITQCGTNAGNFLWKWKMEIILTLKITENFIIHKSRALPRRWIKWKRYCVDCYILTIEIFPQQYCQYCSPLPVSL